MNIIKASAGSGKTYKLSHTYIDYLLSSGDPKAYRHLLAVTFTNKATAEMKGRILQDLAKSSDPAAHRYLVEILHDYSAFGVSTIDSFFQQTLRAFARELGQFSSYQVELDKGSLVSEAMDRMLDSVSPDNKELLDWLTVNAMTSIRDTGRFRIDDGLADMGGRLKSEEFRLLTASTGEDASALFSKQRLQQTDKACRKLIVDFEKRAASLGFPVEKGKHIGAPRKKDLADPAVAELFERDYKLYATALVVQKQLYALGVAREFLAEYQALIREKNVLPLDESGTILKNIIDGSDAPFVYERTGARYSHFLLDEFQDTSRLQWDNFLPLLKDADASSDNLIVGDVKQSIYRFRESDWRLLGDEVQKEFPRSKVESPEANCSACRIVGFNSDFFTYAAAQLGFSDMYSNVKQVSKCPEPQEGCVRLSFTAEQEKAVLQSIDDVRSRGARWSDITILVRGNKEGAKIAEFLIDAGIPIISDDSLDLKKAVTVRRLISLLNYYDDHDNTLGGYLARSIGATFPEHYHSLIDFCEHLLRELKAYDPQTFEAETLFVGAFMDILQDWTAGNGNNVRAFLKNWGEKENCFIGSPANSDAIRIMTIHKSKGLEFPHVILPYADKVVVFKSTTRWCRLSGTPFDGIYPVQLSSNSLSTCFADAYERERSLQAVDNINIFYVALTRASKSLHVIAKEPAKSKAAALKSHKSIDWSNFSEMLYAWCGCSEEWISGTPYDFDAMQRKPYEGGTPFPSVWESIPLAGRLGASQDASDYFGEDGTTGAAASGRLRGIGLHKVLASVDTASDLPLSLDPADREMLSQRIGAHPEWFAPGCARNEVTVFAANGSRYRPDRVVTLPDGGTAIIDYKFGAARDSYLWQVRNYVRLYRGMGRRNVRGYVWYVPEDKVVEV